MESRWDTPSLSQGSTATANFYESYSEREEPSQNVFSPVYTAEQFRNPLNAQSSRYQKINNGAVDSDVPTGSRFEYLKTHRYVIFACLPLIAAVLETILLVYFLMTYLSLPRDPKTGALPRISPVYSTWPFTSCIGSLREGVYKTFAFVVTAFYQSGSLINFYLSRHSKEGYWIRRVGALAGLISSVLLVVLVFSSGNTKTHTHLYITSAKMLATFTVKSFGFICDESARRANPCLNFIPPAVISRRWKEVVAVLSIPLALAANIGIFICKNQVKIQTPGTACYKLMAVGAPSEWIMSLFWISIMVNMAYDFLQSEDISAATKAGTKGSEEESYLNGDRDEGWSPRAEEFELDQTPLFKDVELPATAWTLPRDELHFETMPLATTARGFA